MNTLIHSFYIRTTKPHMINNHMKAEDITPDSLVELLHFWRANGDLAVSLESALTLFGFAMSPGLGKDEDLSPSFTLFMSFIWGGGVVLVNGQTNEVIPPDRVMSECVRVHTLTPEDNPLVVRCGEAITASKSPSEALDNMKANAIAAGGDKEEGGGL